LNKNPDFSIFIIFSIGTAGRGSQIPFSRFGYKEDKEQGGIHIDSDILAGYRASGDG
jgi:hypothetical protein